MSNAGRWEIEIIKKIVRTDEVKEFAAIDATLIGKKVRNGEVGFFYKNK